MKIILFDGICNLCNGSVNFIIKRDRLGIFKFASLQSTVGKSLLKKYGINQEEIDSIIYIKDDRFLIRSAAVLNILKDLGSIWKILYVFIVVPRFLRDFIYNIIARSRYRIFGKMKRCMSSPDNIRNLFLE